MSKKIVKQMAIKLIEDNLKKYFNINFSEATEEQIYKALSATALNELYEIRGKAKKTIDTMRSGKGKKAVKKLHYLTIEILPGRTLESTLFNLGWDKIFSTALKNRGIDINKIYAIEADAGLGNGGLGRLAACFMDSLATLNYPATAHCIKYEHGLFRQRIIDGQQVEFLDEWLRSGNAWLTARPDEAVTVRFNGTVGSYRTEDGSLKFTYHNAQEVEAIPYDMMLGGYDSKAVSNLKLWSAQSKNKGDIGISRDDYSNHLRETQEIESINAVLYPNVDYGRTLRLKQQYFLCSASIQSIVISHVRKGLDLKQLPANVAIHINDTHPALCIPELMRVLMDDHGFSWDDAWSIVTKCVSYTNHTIMQEALEVWDVFLLERCVPRVYQIICEIDRRFRDALLKNKKFTSRVDEMCIISNGQVKTANLAVHASHTVNGVAKIHSTILVNKLFKNFAELYPNKIINITNGVSVRRWLLGCNPVLAEYMKTASEAGAVVDTTALKKLNQIKLNNKKEFARWLFENQGVQINPESRFDVHVKRVHEYKRQLLNILRVIHIYNELKKNPDMDVTPQTFIFAGKAASSYYMAKRIIKLINQVGAEIDKDPRVNKILKVVFVENFSVTVSEKLMPAVEVTQQISLAGHEASGTGNMKAVMNGAIMIGTVDGANAEIAERCGKNGNFMFGLTPDEVEAVWAHGYHPVDLYNSNARITAIVDTLNQGFNGECFKDISSYLLGMGHQIDNYMCFADFDDYMRAHEEMDTLYRKPFEWAKASFKNITNMSHFSSDRSIQEYVRDVWHLTRLK